MVVCGSLACGLGRPGSGSSALAGSGVRSHPLVAAMTTIIKIFLVVSATINHLPRTVDLPHLKRDLLRRRRLFCQDLLLADRIHKDAAVQVFVIDDRALGRG